MVILKLSEKQLNIEHFVIASGKSARHLRKMGDSIITAQKARDLKSVLRTNGIEGTADDDWQLVDCQSFLVHLLLPELRKQIDLEGHWSMSTRPTVAFSSNEAEYENNFEKLMDEYPMPENGPDKAQPPINVRKF